LLTSSIRRLQLASESYHHVLSKKKNYEALPGEHEKVTARDALGIVMVAHGEEFGEDSAFGSLMKHLSFRFGDKVETYWSLSSTYKGSSLVRFGQGMCKVATLQEDHASNLRATFLSSLRTYLDEIQEYHNQKKKLEARRCVSTLALRFNLVDAVAINRLSYDASISKLERLKNSKKEKDRLDAQEEMETAKAK
jgi:BAR domain